MKTIYRLSVILAFFAFTATLNAQVANSIIRDTDPAAMGISGASVAMEANAFALDNNPAFMALYEGHMAAGASYSILQPSSVKMGVIYASGFYKLGSKLALGANFKTLSYQPYPVTSAEGRSTSEYTPRENTFGLGASYLIMEGLSAGLNLKFAQISLAEGDKQSIVGVDIAAAYAQDALSAGLNVRNVGSPVMDVRAGAAYKISVVKALVQAEYLAQAGLMAALGAEYSFKDMVFARAGFHYGNQQKAIPSYLSLGVGAKIAGFGLDIAFLTASKTVGNTVSAALIYSF